MDLGLIEGLLALCVGVLGILQFRQKRALESERGERAEDKRRYESERAEDKRETTRLHNQQLTDRDTANQSLKLIDALREESRMGERMATAIDDLTKGNKASAERLNGTLIDLGEIMTQNTEATNTVTSTLKTVSQTVSQTQDGVKELSVQIDTIHDNILKALKELASGHTLQSEHIVKALTDTKEELSLLRQSVDKLIPPDPTLPNPVAPDFQAEPKRKRA